MSLPVLETTRLRLRPLTAADAGAIFRLYQDEETMRYMPWRPHRSMQETQTALAQELGQGAQFWAICQKGSEEVLGYAGFMGATRVPGMGYILRRDYWGQGITTEAMRAAITHGFNDQGLDRIELWINERNLASQRVAEKLSFRIKGRIHQRYSWEASHHIMLVYGLRGAEWDAAKAPALAKRPAFIGLQPVLLVHDVVATAAFYRDRLGFEIDFLYGSPPEYGGVSRGDWSSEGVTIQLSRISPETALAHQGWLYFMVGTEIDDLHQDYLAKGVEIIHPPQTYPWGMREFSIRDNNGYPLRFGTRDFGA